MFRRSLLLLVICTVLVGVAPAQAQNILDATLTVKGRHFPGCEPEEYLGVDRTLPQWAHIPDPGCDVNLTQHRFTHGGKTYEIASLTLGGRPGGNWTLDVLNLWITPRPPGAFNSRVWLYVGNKPFYLANGFHTGDRYAKYTWHRSGLSWSTDDTVRVRLHQGTPATPGAIPYLTATPGNRKLFIFWFAPGRAVTGYDVQYKKSAVAGDTVTNDPGSGWAWADRHFRQATIAGLKNNTPYDVRVRALNLDKKGPWAVVSGTPGGKSARLAASPQADPTYDLQTAEKAAPIDRVGTNGPDDLAGGAGDDTLMGKKGQDVLRGLDGDDTLYGGKGRDRLIPGNGDDDLSGGPGPDRFVFAAGETGDNVIVDFEAGDLIVLKGTGFSSVADIIAGVVAQGSQHYVYTLSAGLTVETNVALDAGDFSVR